MAAGKNTFIDEMITLAGGENIIKSKLQFPPISEETIIYSNPDIIIVTEKKLKKLIKKNTAIRNTAAFKNNRIIYSIDPDIVSRPGPRFVQGIEALKNVFF
jgi:iron complex transport system substrate-binding protein